MTVHHVTRGLDLPIAGQPEQRIAGDANVNSIALLGADDLGLRAKLAVNEGDVVRRGQLLFENRNTPGVRYTSPAAGRVTTIHRGDHRVLVSVVIELGASERAGDPEEVSFDHASAKDANADRLRSLFVETGLWAAFRTRPFGRVPPPNGTAHSIFVTAMDTEPLAPAVDVVLAGREADFVEGLRVISKLTPGTTFVCRAHGAKIDAGDAPVRMEEFSGKHPAGTPGFHIHQLDPVHRGKSVWYIGYQDVAAIGHWMRTGRLDVHRVIALAGPGVRTPSLLRTRVGAHIDEVVAGKRLEGNHRVISGSVLSGRMAKGPAEGYLGRYHRQIAVIPEGGERHFLGWLRPGFDRFSASPLFGSWFARLVAKADRYRFTTDTYGGRRAMVPIGAYERVMPMDLLPTHLLRALVVEDIEWAEQLGALELEEDDLALCTYVCPGKVDYGPHLRRVLDALEREG